MFRLLTIHGNYVMLQLSLITVDQVFTAEEVGLVGSDYAAEQFAIAGTNIAVMFNFDMVGYDPGNDWELEVQKCHRCIFVIN